MLEKCLYLNYTEISHFAITLQKVLRAISDYAFVTTDYPLILSIENHVDKWDDVIMMSQWSRDPSLQAAPFETYGISVYCNTRWATVEGTTEGLSCEFCPVVNT